MKRKRKRQKKKIRYLLYFIPLLLIGLFIYYKVEYKRVDFLEDRVSQLEKAQKEDVDTKSTIGWLRVQGTNIDMPVVYFEDGVLKNDPRVGYAWNNTKDEHIRKKVDLLGHNILNLSSNPLIKQNNFIRFESLMAFVYYDFAKENQYVEYTIDGENYLYKIFGVRLLDSYADLDTVNDYDFLKEDGINYIETVNKDNLYKYKVDVTGDDNFITLITCTRFYGSMTHAAMVVDARMVRKGELITNYPVVKTDNYKKIEKYMKGDEENV